MLGQVRRKRTFVSRCRPARSGRLDAEETWRLVQGPAITQRQCRGSGKRQRNGRGLEQGAAVPRRCRGQAHGGRGGGFSQSDRGLFFQVSYHLETYFLDYPACSSSVLSGSPLKVSLCATMAAKTVS